jgi:antitoxin component YwqK of YwqJK toxin-antitoxin module
LDLPNPFEKERKAKEYFHVMKNKATEFFSTYDPDTLFNASYAFIADSEQDAKNIIVSDSDFKVINSINK